MSREERDHRPRRPAPTDRPAEARVPLEPRPATKRRRGRGPWRYVARPVRRPAVERTEIVHRDCSARRAPSGPLAVALVIAAVLLPWWCLTEAEPSTLRSAAWSASAVFAYMGTRELWLWLVDWADRINEDDEDDDD
jgi:hypothetical protein